MSNALLLLHAIHDKTKGRDRAVRDVTELETGLTAKAAREAWSELLDRGLIERFSQKYAARLSFKGIDFLASGASLPVIRPATARAPAVVIARGSDTAARQMISNFLAQMDLTSVGVQGPGLMQKVEAHHSVSFAVVLLTPDDLSPGNSMHALMDVGMLMGKFGADHVCAFAVESEGMELSGLTVHPFDDAGAWKEILNGLLQHAGFATEAEMRTN
jgi:predicted nucleotide-binding protein